MGARPVSTAPDAVGGIMGGIVPLSRPMKKPAEAGSFVGPEQPCREGLLLLGGCVLGRAGNLLADGGTGAAHAVGGLVAGVLDRITGLGRGVLGGVRGLAGGA